MTLNIFGVGTDIVKNSRIKKLIKNKKFINNLKLKNFWKIKISIINFR